jgi:RNA polymerase sigma factor (sigma-70 family)
MPDHGSSDSDLWREAAAGSRDAFRDLFRRHAPAVWNHAFRLTASWSQAEDLTSATFMIAWRRRREVVLVRDSALPWLYTVAGNLARTEFRRSSQRLRLVRRLAPTASVADHADDVVDRVDGIERVRRLGEAIRRLPRSQRRVVELCLLGELSHTEAATVLGIAEVTLRAHLSRARTRLRAMLEEDNR